MTLKTIVSIYALATATSLCAANVLAGDESSMSCEGAAHKPSRSGLYCTKCHVPIFSSPVRFACDNKVLTRAYEVALNDTLLNVRMFKDGALKEPARCLMAGASYSTPWTRDTAINVWNAFALLDREVSRNTLMSVVKQIDGDGYIIIGQYWDAVIWAIGAYQYILVSGDRDFVKIAQSAIENSLAKFEREEFDANDGLFRGLAVYGDGVAAYPDLYADTASLGIKKWAQVPENRDKCAKVGVGIPMKALSTNCVYFEAYKILAKLNAMIGKDDSEALKKAEALKAAINKAFWNEAKGTYDYLAGECDYQEALGIAYALLFDVADERQTALVLKNAKVTKQGIACVEPAFDRYLKKNGYGRHSGVVWPHAQGFWARAAFEKGDIKAFEFELNALADKAARDGQFYEIYHPESGKEYGGLQEIRQKDGSMKIGLWGSCKHQTWSATAYLSLVYYHILGADIREGEVVFKPYLPSGVNEIAVKDFKVGETTFDIIVVRGGDGPKEATCKTTEKKRVKLFLSVFVARAEIDVVPYPSSVVEKPGAFKCPAGKELRKVVKLSKDVSIPHEGYRLSVTANGINVAASDKAGSFYALKTLEQLAKSEKGETSVLCVEIEDVPRYSWRGLHLDESRHFFGKDAVKATLDQMARFKLNRFHWHLTDDQGWRIDVPGHPELIEYGSWRPYSPKRPPEGGECNGKKQVSDGKKYGPFFYTEADIKEVIAYAKERHIEVLPEIEFPGHFRAALAAYPAYACFPERIKSRCGRGSWGIEPEVMCAGNDEAIKFIEDVLDYVCKLFPFECVHIGGDECPKGRWKECPRCQARIKAEGLKDEHALQAWLTRHMVEFLAKRGKRTIGWAEYLGAGVPAEAMGMVWMGENVPRVVSKGAAEGHDMIVTPSPFCYLNHGQDLKDDPYPYGNGGRTLEKCYSFDPCLGVTGDAVKHVIGGQGCQWTEYSWDQKDLEWKYWPRMMALAEVFWLGEKKPGLDDFKRRATVQREALIKDGVNAAPLP